MKKIDYEYVKRFFKEIGLTNLISEVHKLDLMIFEKWRLKAKKEVFDDLEENMNQLCLNYSTKYDIVKLKKRHLSTFTKSKRS